MDKEKKGKLEANGWIVGNTEQFLDPARYPTNREKSEAFEWLRGMSIGNTPAANKAAVMLYEIGRLKGDETDNPYEI